MYVRFMQYYCGWGAYSILEEVQLIPDEMYLNQTRLIKSYQNKIRS